jgi:diguanylate cyclase (GGDEF)-like protein/PAS domain S-box-containing protein
MTLQSKTLLIISLAFVGLIAVLYAASQFIVSGSFSDQETQNTRQNMERVRSALDDNLASLEGTTRDWSLWDDTYRYVQDKDQAYYDANLANDSPMSSNRLNLMLYVDEHGQVVFEKSFDYRTGQTIASPPSLLKEIYQGSPLLNLPHAESSITGLLALPESPMLVASEPILPSTGTGAIKGTLIFGRLLDKDQIQHLSKTTLLSLYFQPVVAASMPADFAAVLPALEQDASQASPVEVRVVSSDTIVGYTLLNDVYGKPALILKAEMPRDVYVRGQDTIRYYMIALVCVGLAFGLVIVLLFKNTVFSRLARLDRAASGIATSGDLSARVAVEGSDELSHLAGSMNDMLSALQHSHEELLESEERYRAVIEQTSEAIFLVDGETHHFLQANAASQVLLGYSLDELKEITLDDITVQSSDRTTTRLVDTTGSLRLVSEREYRRRDGIDVPVEVSDSHITYMGRDVLCVVARDITDRKRAEMILRELAMRDGLTGLYNRREMQLFLEEAVDRYHRVGEKTALIMIDLDHFKTVNDTYGHQVGDDALRLIGRLLTELARPEDRAARYGGEELALIMPSATVGAAMEIAERIRLAICAKAFEFRQPAGETERTVTVPISVSIGVAILSEHVTSVQGLVEAADKALYEAKRNGRNCTVDHSTLSPQLRAV